MRLMRTFEGGPPLKEEDIVNFEQKYGLVLPAEYRKFLLRVNGGRPEFDMFPIHGFEGNSEGRIHWLMGLNLSCEPYNLGWYRDIRSERIPLHLLPVATTEGADLICLAVQGNQKGAVFYWDGYAPPGSTSFYFLARSFERFVASLYSNMNSPRATN